MPQKLEEVVKSIAANPECILFCHNEDVLEDGRKTKVLKYGPYRPDMYERLLFQGNCISLSAVTIKKSISNKILGFSENKGFIAAEDYEFWLRIPRTKRS